MSVLSTSGANSNEYDLIIRDGSGNKLAATTTNSFPQATDRLLNVTAVAFFPTSSTFTASFFWQKAPPSGLVTISSNASDPDGSTVLFARFLF